MKSVTCDGSVLCEGDVLLGLRVYVGLGEAVVNHMEDVFFLVGFPPNQNILRLYIPGDYRVFYSSAQFRLKTEMVICVRRFPGDFGCFTLLSFCVCR